MNSGKHNARWWKGIAVLGCGAAGALALVALAFGQEENRATNCCPCAAEAAYVTHLGDAQASSAFKRRRLQPIVQETTRASEELVDCIIRARSPRPE